MDGVLLEDLLPVQSPAAVEFNSRHVFVAIHFHSEMVCLALEYLSERDNVPQDPAQVNILLYHD